jgi:N-acetylmuramoyl-L-alanine amidase
LLLGKKNDNRPFTLLEPATLPLRAAIDSEHAARGAMAKVTHVVQQGDCLISLAARYGVGSARAIYDHADNASLRERRSHPSILEPGDVVTIPLPEARSIQSSPGQTVRYCAARPTAVLRVHFRRDGEALVGEPFELEAGGGTVRGQTGDGGLVEAEIAADCAQALLIFPRIGEAYPILLGHLDPLESPSGIAARLANMGLHFFGSGYDAECLAPAVQRFREHAGLSPDGGIDREFLDALHREHGS